MSNAALNFITFNQDHSCLAVGTFLSIFLSLCLNATLVYRSSQAPFKQSLLPVIDLPLTGSLSRYLERIPYIPYRPLLQNIQQR